MKEEKMSNSREIQKYPILKDEIKLHTLEKFYK